MPAREDENPELNPLCGGDPLARQLAVLQPLPAGLDRDRLLYAAGAAARDRDVLFWRRLFLGQCAVLCTAVGVGVVAFDRPSSSPADPPMARAPEPSNSIAPPAKPDTAPQPRTNDEDLSIPTGPGPGFARVPDETESGSNAKWLSFRADLYASGLGILPTTHAPPPRSDVAALENLEKFLHMPAGVFASPYAFPKRKEKPREADE
jgi:hypothetical protein